MSTSDRFFRTHAGLQLGLTLPALNVLPDHKHQDKPVQPGARSKSAEYLFGVETSISCCRPTSAAFVVGVEDDSKNVRI
jgi:hypothetical protein